MKRGYNKKEPLYKRLLFVSLINIGYDLPMAILRPLGITHAQVFANATNLFCISAVTEFLDPEQEYYDSYPLMRTFSFGLNFSF